MVENYFQLAPIPNCLHYNTPSNSNSILGVHYSSNSKWMNTRKENLLRGQDIEGFKRMEGGAEESDSQLTEKI